jgi:glycosyltransferase involved in cell wall biosynthesis
MRHGKSVHVVIPALDEEAAIGRVLADIPEWIDRIIVADNGSRDRTADIARGHGAQVIHEPERGYGAACLAGLTLCADADIVVFLDADYSDRPAEMASLVDPVARGTADLVVGSRVLGDARPGALLFHQRFGNWLACALMNLVWGNCHTDLGPFRAISSAALTRLDMRDRAYGWTVEMQIKAAKQHLPTLEVPVSYHPRIGVSKISGTLKGTWGAATTILAVIARSAFSRRGRVA